ncbi:MAG: hypothetical protein HOQ10_07515 [Frateuria sp.]|nr:hypothetical protein [Frateuria sp.]
MYRLAILGLLVLLAARGVAAEPNAPGRGALLHATHHLACHTGQVAIPARRVDGR